MGLKVGVAVGVVLGCITLISNCVEEQTPYFTPLEGNGALVSGLCADSTSEFIAIAPGHTFLDPLIGYIQKDNAPSDTFLLDGVLLGLPYEALRDRMERDGIDVGDPCDESLQVGAQVSVSGECGYNGDIGGHYWVIVGDGETYWG